MAEQSPAVAALPFTTPIVRVGREGLNLAKSLDDLSMAEVSRMANLYHTGGDLQTRLGQTLLTTLSGTVHSIRRMNDPRHSSFTRFWGAGTGWFRGASGSGLTQLDAGLSGNPLCLLTTRPPLSGEPYMVMADSNAVRKASGTAGAPSLPLGLPMTGAPTLVVNAGRSRSILAFQSSDGSQAANWGTLGGYNLDQTVLTAAPILNDGAGTVGSAVNMATQVDPLRITTGYTSVMMLAKVLDLSTFSDTTATSDEDIIHLALRMDNPAGVEEVRVYFVVSPFTFQTGTGYNPVAPAIPGTATQYNLAAYVHTYRPSDYAAYAANLQSLLAAQATARNNTLVAPTEGIDAGTENLPGANTWTEFGIVGLPVRRGDFLPIGAAGAPGTDWSTVTGVYIVVTTTAATSVNVAFDDLYITGGYGPDDSEPGAIPFDYRVTNYDPRTGAESNGSATLATTLFVDALRQSITITPQGVPGDSNLRQGFYRRGGSLTNNWYFCGFNTANGAAFVDTLTDAAILNAAVVPVDHFQPVATVDNAGATILAQPLPIMFGPFDDGTICALGDPYRPGHLYACLPGEVDHWPSTGAYAVEVCSPAEELMNGGIIGGAGFVLSRERGYVVHTNLAGGAGIVVTPSGCTPGLDARWGFCVGPGGVYYVARDGIRVTTGGESTVLSEALWPLFHAQTVNGYAPIDFSVPAAIRLSLHETDLWFLYQDTNGTRQCLVYSLLWRYWRPYSFTRVVAVAYSDETQNEQDAQGDLQLLFGSTNGKAYTYSGRTDDGTAIPWSLRTGAWAWGQLREEKLLGDLVIETDLQGSTLSAQLLLNLEATVNNAQTVVGLVGRNRYTFDPSGTTPQHARTVSLNLSGTAPTTAPVTLAWAGLAVATQPEITMNRATTWEPLGSGGEAYLKGGWIDSDTGGSPRSIVVEGLLNGTPITVASITVTSAAGRRQWFSWPAVHVDLIRLRPTGSCAPWMLFGCGWLWDPEPPRLAVWDSNFETLGDSYYTGLDLECDTFNQAKTIVVTADGVAVGGSPFTVTANGRSFIHLTITPGRAHVFRFYATDGNLGLLYSHKWLVESEPEEQAHWNAGYTVYSSLSDKYLKGIVIEADTFGQAKTVNVEADGVVVATITPVTHAGRTIKNYTFAQVLGRVFRIIPTDTAPSRLYTAQPLFDEEPFALARWESQLLDFNLPASGWGSILSADLTYRSTDAATLTVTYYSASSIVPLGTITLPVPSTAGVKQKLFIPFPPNKGVLFKLVFAVTNDHPVLTLYKEESRLRVQPWSSPLALLKPFGNDDLDPTREMTKAAVAAGRQGGAAR